MSAKAAGKLRADLFVLRPRLCLFVTEPEQNIHLPLSKKKASGLRKRLGFLVNVSFWSALNLTRVRVRLSATTESFFTAGLRGLWAERILCRDIVPLQHED